MAERKPRRTSEERAKNMTRRESIRTVEDLYAEPPPNYSRTTSVQASIPGVTSESTSVAALISIEELDFKPSPLELPTPAECITHLKLLHAFAKLRYDVGNHDGLFGIHAEKTDEKVDTNWNIDDASRGHDQQNGNDHKQKETDEEIDTLAADHVGKANALLSDRIREKRWTVFVTKAVDRFEKWWSSIPNSEKHSPKIWYSPIVMKDFDSMQDDSRLVSKFPIEGDGIGKYTSFCLPPLDVLMVWHSYMLNPRNYLEDCIRYTKHALWRTPFPWQLIYEAIDNETFDYHPNDFRTFQNMTDRAWDPLEDETLKQITCPRCVSIHKVSWTTVPTTTTAEAITAYLDLDTGFSSPTFKHICSTCDLIITHEKLRVGKFISDADAVMTKEQPLPGTILNTRGIPECTSKGKHIETHDPFFPNRVVEHNPKFQPTFLRKNVETLSIAALKTQFEELIRSKDSISEVNPGQKISRFLAKGSKIAIRMMLSRYWDNSSVFGLDLVGAVLRQGTFVQKMWKLNWLRSPGLMATVQRAIIKYHRFVGLTVDNPKQSVVPTLDVDLAWHTHQLTPKIYYQYTVAEAKKFLNHDDKTPESTLNKAFKWTSRAYEQKYGQPYSECSCWYCECTREPMRSYLLSKLSSRRSSLSVERLEEKNFPTDPYLGPHVSSHNAIALADERSALEKRRELQDLDALYAKVCKRYQKKNSKPPPRDDPAILYSAYGYPFYPFMPFYVPSHADENGGHAGNAGGGCVAGTCSASASLGSCAGGSGAPTCAASCQGGGTASGGCGSCSGGGGGGGGCGS